MSLPIAELQNEYTNRVIPSLKEKRGYKNVHQVPRLVKVVINTSVGSAPDVKAALEIAKDELSLITGQKPVETISKKAISNFKLRAGQAIGAKVTLRGRIMYEFLERLIKTATTPSVSPTSRSSPRWNSTRSSGTSVSTSPS